MTLINSPLVLAIVVASLLRANNLNIIDQNQLQKILAEIYFQPYSEFSQEALYYRFPDFDKTLINADFNADQRGYFKIAIQVGHLLEQELPLELRNLGRHGGAKKGRLREVEVNKAVAAKVKSILETELTRNKNKYEVEILSAIIPPAYQADVFVALHANYDGVSVSGFMISEPAIDYSGKASDLKKAIIDEYTKTTALKFIPYASENMTHYYSFNWSKFKRAIHPKTPAVILEMGNLRNLKDLTVLTLQQEAVAQGIANGIIRFLNSELGIRN